MPEPYKPEQSLGFVLNDVARIMRRNFNRRVQELELTQAQWQGLIHISRNPGMNQSQLADILEVQPISVGRLIDRLEAAGWVKRSPDPEDRRAINLFLTDKAEPILTKMQKHGTATKAQALKGIPEQEQEIMLRVLLTMRKNLIGEEGQDNE